MNKVFFLDIIEQDGLYIFNRNQFLINDLSELYQVTVPSSDNISSLNDIVISIEDELPDIVLITLNKNCSQLIISLIKVLILTFDGRVVLLTDKALNAGVLNLYGDEIDVIGTITDLQLTGLEHNIYPANSIFDMDISYNGRYLSVMQNGIYALYSGAYPTANYLSNLKHLIIKDEGFTIDLSKTKDLFDINSAIVFPQYTPKQFERLKRFEMSLYNHVHQLEGSVIHFDNWAKGIPLVFENYSKCKNNSSVFMKVVSKNDIECLKKDVDLFKESGKIAKLGNRFINECALGVSPCILTKMFRGSVDANNKFYPCPESSTSIGSVYDDSFELVKNASRISRKCQISRQCEKCNVYQECSKCAMLPDDVSEEEYCNLIRYEGAADYCKKLTLLGMVLESSRVFHDVREYPKIEVSSCYRPLTAHICEYETSLEDKRKKVVLLAFRHIDDYYVFAYKSSKLYKTDEKFIYIAELYAYGVSIQAITEKYSYKFEMQLDKAIDHITEAIQMINNEVIA